MNPREMLERRTIPVRNEIRVSEWGQDVTRANALKNAGGTEAPGDRYSVVPRLQRGHSVYTELMRKHDRAHPRFLG